MAASSWRVPVVIFAAATLVKVLLIPSYRSTDFEVHRNWLAITHSLPISRWYYEDTSEWTLDYPPFFAWFEWLLSWPAVLVDPGITELSGSEYSSPACVLFQRFSVIASDLVLLYAAIQYCRCLKTPSPGKPQPVEVQRHYHGNYLLADRKALTLSLLLLFNYGLIIVDHIHFQYNGFLFGILILSIARLQQGRTLEGALLFAVLLNFKHIFLYIAPAYFVFLLKHYCFRDGSSQNTSCRGGRSFFSLNGFSFGSFLRLGLLVVAVFALSFGPFLYMAQLGQVISRLFPFKRGLCHAYWAPNVWALYNMADKLIAVLGLRLGLLSPTPGGGMTSGLVGELEHQVLPSIPPWVTLLVTLAAMMPSLLRLWLKPSTPIDFIKCLILCAYSSFLFGWHVHEKAVMLITIPMCLLAAQGGYHSRIFFLLSTTGHISLFPLLFKPAETPVKLSLFVFCTAMSYTVLSTQANNFNENASEKTQPSSSPSSSSSSPSLPRPFPGLTWLENGYIAFLLILQVYCVLVHGTGGLLAHLEFLPLLVTSVSCAAGLVWSWVLCYYELFTGNSSFV